MTDIIETVRFLERYQQWRKGEVDRFYADSDAKPGKRGITKAIDAAIEALRARVAELEAAQSAQPVSDAYKSDGQAVADDAAEEIEAIASCLEDDAAIVREADGYEEVPANMEKAAALIRRLAAHQPAAQTDTRAGAVERAAELAGRVAGEETAKTIRNGGVVLNDRCQCIHCMRLD